MSAIQPSMRRLIAFLTERGFITTDSGDGVTNVKAGMEDALDYPHVFMVSDDVTADADHLAAVLLHERGIVLSACFAGPRWIQGSYDPIGKQGVVMLAGVTDKDLW